MSISAEIARLQQAKSDLATSITNKGVTVPAATTLDGYAALVDQIQTGGGGGFPYGSEIEYLQGTGTQYIDTLFYPRVSSTDIKVESKFNKSVLSGDNCVMGARTGNEGTKGFKLPNFYNNTLECQGIIDAGSGTNQGNLIGTFSENTDYVFYAELKQGIQRFYVNGVLNKQTSFTRNCDAGGNLYLFAMHQSGVKWFFNGRIYYCKIWQDDALVRDYIPVRIGNTGYMYDKVSQTLFGNSGTGSFTLGSDVT